MPGTRLSLSLSAVVLFGLVSATQCRAQVTQGPIGPPAPKANSPKSEDSAATVPMHFRHGQKLMLKDGSYQLVESYERKGDRVRYFSSERKAWEEIPAALVDWGATAKAQLEAKDESSERLKKIQKQEAAEQVNTVMDVDASLQVEPGVFLPPSEGMFVIDGKSVKLLDQVKADEKLDKKRRFEQIISPIPIVPGKKNIEVKGARAKVRVDNSSVEFYLREAPPDPDRVSPIRTTSGLVIAGPEVELVRAKVKGDKRQLETLRSLFGEQLSAERDTISIQRWDIAATVFRFTLSQPLPPGEYALAEILPDGMNMYVWDFGVDAPQGNNSAKK
jgi:hypothetical protein